VGAENKTPNYLRILVTFLHTTSNGITVTTHRDIISLSFLKTSGFVIQTEKCPVRQNVNFILSKRIVNIRSLDEQKKIPWLRCLYKYRMGLLTRRVNVSDVTFSSFKRKS